MGSIPYDGLEEHKKMLEGDEVKVLYWKRLKYWKRNVSGLLRDGDGKYLVKTEDGRSMGRIMGEALIEES